MIYLTVVAVIVVDVIMFVTITRSNVHAMVDVHVYVCCLEII